MQSAWWDAPFTLRFLAVSNLHKKGLQCKTSKFLKQITFKEHLRNHLLYSFSLAAKVNSKLFIVCMLLSCYIRFSEPIHTLYFLQCQEFLARNRRDIWSLSEYNETRTHNHLVHKGTLNHLVKPTKWLSCVVSSYMYGAFDCMLLSCHVRFFSVR